MTIVLSTEQDAAVRKFRDWWQETGCFASTRDFNSDEGAPYYLQQGFAGTGKSTVLPFFIESIGLKPSEVCFMAPTGKAAKVMTRKLADQGINNPAMTIHKAIYRPKGLPAHALEANLAALNTALGQALPTERHDIERRIQIVHRDLEKAYLKDMPGFQLNVDSSVMEFRLLVVDEGSMVGEEVAGDLRSFGIPILVIGDPGQLQPVGDKPGFFTRSPDHLLSEIHRQAQDNPIIWASMLIRQGKEVPLGSHGGGLLRVIEKEDDDVTFDLGRDVQIIVGRNETRWNITRKTRRLSGFDALGPQTGEMLICVKNSLRYPTLVNGSMLLATADTSVLKSGDLTCKVFAVDEEGVNYELNSIQAIFEENYLGKGQATVSPRALFHGKLSQNNHQLDWAIAITCHKSQGSQWDDVVVHDESWAFREQRKSWLYTSVTRAAKTLTLVVS